MKQLVNSSLSNTIRDLLLAHDYESLSGLLDELQPFDIAMVLRELEEPQQLEILSLTSSDIAAEALEHLDYDEQYKLLDHSKEDVSINILAVCQMTL